MFQGFSPKAVEFLWEIRFHNERGWFSEHKAEYLTLIELPLRQLSREISQTMTEEFPRLGLELKISRIYRDARRLHGRGPYKDHMWFSLRRRNEAEGNEPCFYFEIAPERYSFGMGCYAPFPATMAKLRARIDRDPKPLERLARRLEKQDVFVLDGACYHRPKGDPGPLLSPWYNRRQLSLNCDRNCEGTLFSPALTEELLEGFRFLVPYYRYLQSVAGDPAPDHM